MKTRINKTKFVQQRLAPLPQKRWEASLEGYTQVNQRPIDLEYKGIGENASLGKHTIFHSNLENKDYYLNYQNKWVTR